MAYLKYYGELRELTGAEQETYPGDDIKECLKHIKTDYGKEAYAEAKRSLITVNGKGILNTGNYRTRIQDQDEIRFLPLCGGG